MLARVVSHTSTPGPAPVIVNVVGFQLGWFACVLGAASGTPWLGPLVALPVLGWHLASARRRGPVLGLLLLAGLVGLGLDSLLIRAGLLTFREGIWAEGAAPYWMVVLWMLFASTLNVGLRRLHGRLLLAAVLGAIGGPLAYRAGVALGAAEATEPRWLTDLAVALAYALATPLLVGLARRLDGFAAGSGGRP